MSVQALAGNEGHMLSLDVYETWSNLVKKHTVDGACNFQAAACELAKLAVEVELENCITVCEVLDESNLQLRYEYRRGVLDCVDLIRKRIQT